MHMPRTVTYDILADSLYSYILALFVQLVVVVMSIAFQVSSEFN